MKRKRIFFIYCLPLVITALLSGCFLVEFPYDYDNPLDPDYESGGTYELLSESARRMYEDRGGISFASALDITLDNAYLLAGDRFKPEVLVYNIAGDSGEYINLGGEAAGIVDIAGLSGEAYIATGNAVFRADLAAGTFEQIGDITVFDILYYDIDTADGIAYMITRENSEESGEVYSLRWYDEAGAELGRVDGDLFRNVEGFTVSSDYVFLASNEYACINVVDQADGALEGQVYYDGSAMQQAATAVPNTYDTNYSYYGLDWDTANSRLAAVVGGLSGSAVACSVVYTDPITPPAAITYSLTTLNDISDWHTLKLAVDHATSTLYGADAVFRNLRDMSGNTVLFDAPTAENDEFVLVSDMEISPDGTVFLVDELTWRVQYLAPDGTWNMLGTPARYVPGNPYIEYPYAAAVNAEETLIAMGGGGSILQNFTSGGTYQLDLDIGSVGYGHISDIELYPDGNFVLWDGDNKRIGYFDVGSLDQKNNPYNTETIRRVDLEISGGRTYAAAAFDSHSMVGYFTGTDFSENNFRTLWRSDEENYFAQFESDGSRRFFIDYLSPVDGGFWCIFQNLASAVKFSDEGDVIGSFCLREDFEGERVLQGRFYDYAHAGDTDAEIIVGGFSAYSITEEDLVADYLSCFVNGSGRLRTYRVVFPAAD